MRPLTRPDCREYIEEGAKMTDYDAKRKEEHAKTAAVRAKIDAAAKLLTAKCEPISAEDDPRDGRVYVTGADIHGRAWSLFVRYSASYGSKRIEASGNYPRHADNSYASGSIYYTPEERKAGYGNGPGEYGKIPQASITISPEKTPAQIARDIEKRLLPAVIDYTRRVQSQIDATNDYEIRTSAALETLKGAALTEYETKDHKFNSEYREDRAVRYHVSASCEKIAIDIYGLTVDQARRILEVIK
jgi:hypothetical protein